VVVAVVIFETTGAALVHPPKSSSGATVAAVVVDTVAGAPHPAPMSLEVNLSGILIMSADERVVVVVVGGGRGAATGGAGVESGVLHALPPQGSMLAEENMLVTFDVDVVGAAFCVDWMVALLDERLKTDDTLDGVLVVG